MWLFGCIVLLSLCLQARAATPNPQIDLEGLMPNAAILLIDGERKLLKKGQSHNGVTLVSAYSNTATIEVNGNQMVLGLSRKVGTNYQPPPAQTVTIRRDSRLQYQTSARINGRQVKVLVDTGANVVALNQSEASRLGIDLEKATPARVETASGIARAWSVKLRSVSVGGIKVDNVPATVVEGEFPAMVLLGMTYLRHVKIEENQGILTLSRSH
ncbi:retropepsin-like aspartic protease family protein [Seongchinamella unica]|uniref:retropepsin-like aspartic protease family protein n=1 Tax=Seongchinamella unica TaxID=2547392 RepID=UPI001404E95C|nr:TIGR02281 family clan AA aspartic protease [Seongchinamella unica]